MQAKYDPKTKELTISGVKLTGDKVSEKGNVTLFTTGGNKSLADFGTSPFPQGAKIGLTIYAPKQG